MALRIVEWILSSDGAASVIQSTEKEPTHFRHDQPTLFWLRRRGQSAGERILNLRPELFLMMSMQQLQLQGRRVVAHGKRGPFF